MSWDGASAAASLVKLLPINYTDNLTTPLPGPNSIHVKGLASEIVCKSAKRESISRKVSSPGS